MAIPSRRCCSCRPPRRPIGADLRRSRADPRAHHFRSRRSDARGRACSSSPRSPSRSSPPRARSTARARGSSPATNLDVVLVLDYSKSMYAQDVPPLADLPRQDRGGAPDQGSRGARASPPSPSRASRSASRSRPTARRSRSSSASSIPNSMPVPGTRDRPRPGAGARSASPRSEVDRPTSG